jgi:hypothetical protein
MRPGLFEDFLTLSSQSAVLSLNILFLSKVQKKIIAHLYKEKQLFLRNASELGKNIR